MTDFVLKMFVSKVEDHGLLADLLFADHARLHGGDQFSWCCGVWTPNSWQSSTSLIDHYWLDVFFIFCIKSHDSIIKFEYISMSNPIVNSQIMADFRIIWTPLDWTLEWRFLRQKKLRILLKIFQIMINKTHLPCKLKSQDNEYLLAVIVYNIYLR